MTGTDVLLVEHPSDDIVVLRLNRPQVRNALNIDVRLRLAAEIARYGADSTTRCLIITGSDTVFAAGADITEMAGAGPVEVMARNVQQYYRAIMDCPKPVIAAVEGFALGGGLELVLACDFAIASPRAKFGLPEVTLGVIPGFGGTQRLARLIGRHNALRWILSGDVHSADEALRLGLVTQIVEPELLLATVLEVAQRIATRGPLALAAARQVVDQGWDLPLADGLRKEAAAFGKLFLSRDQKEGMAAFIQKRPAKFEGK